VRSVRRSSPSSSDGRGRSAREPLPAGFGTIWSTVAIDLVGFGIVLPILPQYAERFGATPFTTGLIFASFSVAQLVFAPVMGRLSDRIGRKPVLILSLFGTAIGSLLTGLAAGIPLLFIGRVIDGASGASVSVAQAAAADLAPPHQRARLMGLLGAAFGVGFVAGPAIGALGALGGAHVPFFLAAAISFVNAVIAIRRLPETLPSAPGHDGGHAAATDAERIAEAPGLDGPGLVEPAHVSFHAEHADQAEDADQARRAGDAAHGPAAGVPAGTPGGPVTANPAAIIRLIVVAFVAMVAFSGFESTFSLLGERRFGFQLATTGAVFTAIGIALVLVQVRLVGRVADRLGEIGTIRAGLVANAIGLAVLSVDGGWATLVPALGLLVVGQGLLTPTLSAAVAGLAGRERGQWLGWQQSAGGLARVGGPVLAGALFQFAGTGIPYVVAAGLVLVALVLVPGHASPAARPTSFATK